MALCSPKAICIKHRARIKGSLSISVIILSSLYDTTKILKANSCSH